MGFIGRRGLIIYGRSILTILEVETSKFSDAKPLTENKVKALSDKAHSESGRQRAALIIDTEVEISCTGDRREAKVHFPSVRPCT
jgi:hypothetical protein